MKDPQYDVCVIGGGPAGSTLGSLLKKHNPDIGVLILERERFPREHIGESMLPPICHVLEEMGCWEKVEAAHFPVKVGVTYRWGYTDDLWDFDLLAGAPFVDNARPGVFKGQRKQTAFQVERSIYDDILLKHAASMGCEVREETKVTEVLHEGDRITSLKTERGETFTGRYYVDASGNSGIMRRALGIELDAPSTLKNIAIWDYWDDAEWAVTIGHEGTRSIILSLGYGWIWIIPIGQTRASIGFVTSAEYYKESGMTPEQLLEKALDDEPTAKDLIRNAKAEGVIRTTRDWSYVAQRMVGENWLMVGECAGFADPILSAGLTLAQTGAREAAYTILALDKGELDSDWLKRSYEEVQKKRTGAHIRFANFWYAGNGMFTDLKASVSEIAKENGLTLNAEQAFQWLGTGGFTHDNPSLASLGVFSLGAVKSFAEMFLGGDAKWFINDYNSFSLRLQGAEKVTIPLYENGTITPMRCYRRDHKVLPSYGLYKIILEILTLSDRADHMLRNLRVFFTNERSYPDPEEGVGHALETLEVMVREGWVVGKMRKQYPKFGYRVDKEGSSIHKTRDFVAPRKERKDKEAAAS